MAAMPFFLTKTIHQSEEGDQVIGTVGLYGGCGFSGEFHRLDFIKNYVHELEYFLLALISSASASPN